MIRWWSISAAVVLAPAALAQETQQGSLLTAIQAAGWVGYMLILLSVVGVAAVVNGVVMLRPSRLLPPGLMEQAQSLVQRGRFGELLSVAKTAEQSLLARMIAAGLSDGRLGLEAVREGMTQEGQAQVTRLQQQVGYIGLIAAVAPLLGLLGTVLGMIDSFNVLGQTQGAARPDELASGIATALITTCMGLILAVPLLFFHAYLRDRVTRTAQEAGAVADRLLRQMAVSLDTRNRSAPAGTVAGAPQQPTQV